MALLYGSCSLGVRPLRVFLVPLLLLYILQYAAVIDGSMNETVNPKFEHVNCGIYKREITVSGLSTGSTFAQTLHLSHSKLLAGVGNFAGFFYKCGGFSSSGTLEEHYAKCGAPGGFPTNGFSPNANLSSSETAIQTLKEFEAMQLIDPLSGLEKQKVWIWIAAMDQFIPVGVASSVVNIYEPYLKLPTQIRSVIQRATHHLPTVKTGPKCDQLADVPRDAFIGSCDFNGPKEMLDFLLSGDGYRVESPDDLVKVKSLLEFDQTQFFKDIQDPISMDDIGFIYIPTQCESPQSKCRVHFYFHGCFIARGDVGKKHAENSGFLQVAEKNGIIIVFPQAKKTKENPYTCWDIYGYTGPNYGNQKGSQVRVVRRMITRFH